MIIGPARSMAARAELSPGRERSRTAASWRGRGSEKEDEMEKKEKTWLCTDGGSYDPAVYTALHRWEGLCKRAAHSQSETVHQPIAPKVLSFLLRRHRCA